MEWLEPPSTNVPSVTLQTRSSRPLSLLAMLPQLTRVGPQLLMASPPIGPPIAPKTVKKYVEIRIQTAVATPHTHSMEVPMQMKITPPVMKSLTCL